MSASVASSSSIAAAGKQRKSSLTGLAGYGQKRRYYTPQEVAMHNCLDDCWVSVLGNVFDLTEIVNENLGPLARPLVEMAGKDISYLFDPKTGDPKTWVEPVTNLKQYYLPCGRFIHAPPGYPLSTWKTALGEPWWRNPDFRIGKVSKKTRKMVVVNTLTRKQDVLTVCSEETINEIRDRYLSYNAHAGSYTWKRLEKDVGFVKLDMGKTLEENGLPDESEEFQQLGIDEDVYMPIVHIYWDDDLTVA